MESNCRINSVEEEEEEETEQESVDLGVGRLYECVFCKRGFNTAQALGGHMNIHRKDRVKNKPNSSKQEQEQHLLSPPGMYQYHHINIPPPDQIFAYFPVPTTVPGIGAVYGNYQHHHHPQFLSVDSDIDHRQIKPLDDPVVPVGDNWSLSLRFVEDLEREKNQEEELDLELRLGYDS